jgi:hypothetical protein
MNGVMRRSTFVRGMYYWFKAYAAPGAVVDEFQSDADKVLVSFWINLTFSSLYAVTALLGEKGVSVCI